MRHINIHPTWGAVVEFNDPQEVFIHDRAFWREFLYKHQLVIFKKMDFSLEDYAKLGHLFGRPWKPHEYKATLEIPVEVPGTNLCVSEFSNKIVKRIGDEEMMWHSDIPNKVIKPFPVRALWMDKNPNPQVSGKTRWVNITLDRCWRYLRNDQAKMLDKIIIEQQSWHKPGTEIRQYPFIKEHEITGEKSLRLNAYCTPEDNNLWIKRVFINGVAQPDCNLVKDFIETLVEVPELGYTHTWDDRDIAVYDNWSFIHGRTEIVLDEVADERKLYRINIDHTQM